MSPGDVGDGLLDRLTPDDVATAEAFDDTADAPLYPEERAAIARAVDKRRREFATVRRCARAALGSLGLPPAPLLPGERGAPGWPSGVVGSMTHCDGYRAAAVARSGAIASLGVDAEPNAPLPDGVLGAVTVPDDRAALADLPPGDVCWDRLLFCAKESIYKTWFPLTRRWLGFEDASVRIDPSGTFHARLSVDGPLPTVDGRWLADRGLLLAVIVRRPGDARSR